MPAPKGTVTRIATVSSREDLQLLVAFLFLALLFLAALRPAAAELGSASPAPADIALNRAGTVAETTEILQRKLASGTLNTQESGKAWHVLALALEEQSRFAESRRAFENAVRALSTVPGGSDRYAAVLEDFGALHAATGQFDLAIRLQTEALHVYEQLQDHTSMARGYNNLTELALRERRLREGKRYMQRAEKEMYLVSDLGDDDRAAIVSTGGLLARLSDNDSESIAKQYRALELWKKAHGEESSQAGLGYVSLGVAYSHAGRHPEALENTRHGVAILGRAADPNSPVLLVANLAYAQVLDVSGQHKQASQIRAATEQQRKNLEQGECARCTVSAVAFRDHTATPLR